MKIVVVSTLVFLLLSLKLRRNAFFSSLSPSLPQLDHGFLVSKLLNAMKSSSLVMFFVFNVAVMAIFLWSFKPSCGDFTSCFSLPPLVYEEENEREEAKDEDCDDNEEDFVPRLVYVEYKKDDNFASCSSLAPVVCEIEHGEMGKDHDNKDDFALCLGLSPLVCDVDYEGEKAKAEDYGDNINNNDDFVPRLVCIEYYKEERAKDEHWLLANVDNGSDNNATSEDEEGDDLEKRTEEFIANTYKNWREELLNDKLLCLPAA